MSFKIKSTQTVLYEKFDLSLIVKPFNIKNSNFMINNCFPVRANKN